MFGKKSSKLFTLFGAEVHTNLEAVLVLFATSWSATSWAQAGTIVFCVAAATGLHVAGHWVAALGFGGGIDRVVFTRAGGIDFGGPQLGLRETVVRDAAGPATNAALALGAGAILHFAQVQAWPELLGDALVIFALSNAGLALLNFLPALPLDGGLILRAGLRAKLGTDRGHLWTRRSSLAILTLVAAAGALLRQPALAYFASAMAYDVWRAGGPPSPEAAD